MRMHGQKEQTAFVIRTFEFSQEDAEDGLRRRIGPERLKTMHVKVGRVVPDPLDGKFNDPRRLAFVEQLVRVVVGHERAVVQETHLPLDLQRCGREIPGRCPHADGPHASDAFQCVGRPKMQVPLYILGQGGVQLVDPAVEPDLVSLGDELALLFRMKQGSDCRNEKGRASTMATQRGTDARYADPAAILAPREPAYRLATVPQFVGLMIAIEGEGHRDACAAWP